MGGEPIEVIVRGAYVYWMGLVHRLLGLKMKEIQTFETSESIYPTTQRHIATQQ